MVRLFFFVSWRLGGEKSGLGHQPVLTSGLLR